MTTSQIIIGGITGTLSLAPHAEQIKADALAKAKAVAQVTTPDELDVAVEARRELNDIAKGVEKTRKELKAPILKAGKDLDKLADDFIADVEKEKDRLDGHINHWQREQLRIAEEARKAAEEAQRKAEAEQARLQAELEAARRREEEAQKAAENAKTAAAKAKAEADAKAAREAQEAAEEKQFAAQLAAESTAAPAVIPEQPKGVSSRVTKDFRIIGKNEYEQRASLLKLAAKYPHLIKIEARRADILSTINQQGITELPGLEVFDEVTTRIR